MRQIAIAFALVVSAALPAEAADPPTQPPSDADALSLADETPAVKPTSQSWRLFGEGALAHSWLRNPFGSGNEGRASIDFRYDGAVAPQLRAVLSNRLDLIHRGGDLQPREENVNTLREAYLSWHATPELISFVFDLINNFITASRNRKIALRSTIDPFSFLWCNQFDKTLFY